ncbi:MAG: type I-C CRISPR-associated protein Cas5c [Oscillospiraceae bacterium]
MGFGFRVRVEGDYALFSRPELKVERYTYDVITPSAARGVLEAICWKPAIRYVIDKIHVMKPIQVTNIRRNEVSAKGSANLARSAMRGNGIPLYISTSNTIQQRASLILKDVSYIIEAHFEMTEKAQERDTPEKFYNMILRRIRNGQCYHQPYLGCREFPARFYLVEEGEAITPLPMNRDLGLMLYDLDYSDPEQIQPTFFQAVLKGGTIDLTDCEVMR